MRVCLLASGSKGNAVYCECSGTRLLIDAGLSGKAIATRLQEIGVEPEGLDAILISHEHGDHCRGVGPLSRRYDLPVYLHPETHKALPGLGRIDQLHKIAIGEQFTVGNVTIGTFPTTHDVEVSVGYTLTGAEGKIGLATDLGLATRLVLDHLQKCRVLVLETNHDEMMLRDGPYPWPLKQRIKGRHGHLSNTHAAELLKQVLWPGMEAVFLAHLSETNNSPELALAAINGVLDDREGRPEIFLGYQDRVSQCFTV